MDLNKTNIIQPVPMRACDHSVETCTYCKYKAAHPTPIPSGWASEDWDGEKAKMREQRSLIDLNFPKPDQRQMGDSDILRELWIQNLNIQEDEEKRRKNYQTLQAHWYFYQKWQQWHQWWKRWNGKTSWNKKMLRDWLIRKKTYKNTKKSMPSSLPE